MAEGFEFTIDGLEELERDLRMAIEKAPAQAEETLIKLAKEFKRDAKERAKAELKPHERKEEQKNKSIERKWGHKLTSDRLSATVMVWNSARHFHLIENGHNLVERKSGRVIGFVPGKHIMEKTRNEYKEIVPERFEKMVEDILKENHL